MNTFSITRAFGFDTNYIVAKEWGKDRNRVVNFAATSSWREAH
jgi:hypothetical protein